MRSRSRTESGPNASREGRPLELVRVRGSQRNARSESRDVAGRRRRRGGRGRPRSTRPPTPPQPRFSFWTWLKQLFAAPARRAESQRPTRATQTLGDQEARALADFGQHFGITFNEPALLKLALTHRSYLSVTGMGPNDSNERLEFLGDSVLGLVTSEFLYRAHPGEHEGQLTKAKSLLVSKAILSRRALAMGLGRFVLMSHSEVESGGRQRLSIIADAFEAVVGAIYLDQGFESSRTFIERWLLKDAKEISSDKRHTNYKSHLQEYVQSTFRTHPVYRIRGEMGPDHSKHFNVEVMVGRRVLGEGKGRNKKEAEQAAARDALERVEGTADRGASERHGEPGPVTSVSRAPVVLRDDPAEEAAVRLLPEPDETENEDLDDDSRRRRGRRGGRGRRTREMLDPVSGAEPAVAARLSVPAPIAVSAPDVEVAATTPSLRRPQPMTGIPVALPPEDGRFERLGHEVMGDDHEDVEVIEVEPAPAADDEHEFEEIGRPEGPHEERHVDVYASSDESASPGRSWTAPRELASSRREPASRTERRPARASTVVPDPREDHASERAISGAEPASEVVIDEDWNNELLAADELEQEQEAARLLDVDADEAVDVSAPELADQSIDALEDTPAGMFDPPAIPERTPPAPRVPQGPQFGRRGRKGSGR